MNAPECQAEDYINDLVASPRAVSGTEAARVQPAQDDPPAQDAFTRLLHRREPDSATLWAAAAPQVQREAGSWSSTTAPWTRRTPGSSAC